MKNNILRTGWLLMLAVVAITSLRSTCGCRGNTAAKEAFFAPGSIKFKRVR